MKENFLTLKKFHVQRPIFYQSTLNNNIVNHIFQETVRP